MVITVKKLKNIFYFNSITPYLQKQQEITNFNKFYKPKTEFLAWAAFSRKETSYEVYHCYVLFNSLFSNYCSGIFVI